MGERAKFVHLLLEDVVVVMEPAGPKRGVCGRNLISAVSFTGVGAVGYPQIGAAERADSVSYARGKQPDVRHLSARLTVDEVGWRAVDAGLGSVFPVDFHIVLEPGARVGFGTWINP